jgi:hypothetical protein
MKQFKIRKQKQNQSIKDFEIEIYQSIKAQLKPTYRLRRINSLNLEEMTANIRFEWVNDEHENYTETIKLNYEQS